ncbi:efflux transporter outer membrane subunit [Methylogaea oryzae]|uniref:RND transporter n=2 Tax=Methylogaea oryzae TaxID=1295382 RepID=A0A8D5AKZ6_9GAMM|nr:efflux transporter outer membrane subunit [Methylogaea oryzae]BBL69660.1 RND transporter [Methylogaea oryzae]
MPTFNHRRRVAALLAAGLLGGCAVGPDYQPPAAEGVGTSFANAGLPEFSPDAPDLAWWRQFQDAQLSGLVDQALAHNRDLRAAGANLEEARALYLQSGLDLLPTVTARGSYNEQKRSVASMNNRAFVPRELKLYSTGFDASWELDLWGRIRRNVESRDAEVQVQEADYRDLMVSLIAEVARNYFSLRGLQNQLAVAQRNAENQAQTLKLTQARLDAGRGTELDTARAQAQLDTTRATIPPMESAIHQAIHRLGVLTGQAPGALTVALLQPVPLAAIPAVLHIGNPADLLRRRPDIRVAERSLASATAQIGVATADLFPRVTFVGTIALEGSTFAAVGGGGSDGYSAGPRITWAALDLGRVYARIKAADARAEASLAQYEQTVLNALEETENALVDFNRRRAQRDILAQAARASQRAHELAHLRFQDGAADFLTVLDTELRLLQDQQRLAQSETETATALVALYKALGGGWENSVTAESH